MAAECLYAPCSTTIYATAPRPQSNRVLHLIVCVWCAEASTWETWMIIDAFLKQLDTMFASKDSPTPASDAKDDHSICNWLTYKDICMSYTSPTTGNSSRALVPLRQSCAIAKLLTVPQPPIDERLIGFGRNVGFCSAAPQRGGGLLWRTCAVRGPLRDRDHQRCHGISTSSSGQMVSRYASR